MQKPQNNDIMSHIYYYNTEKEQKIILEKKVLKSPAISTAKKTGADKF